MGGRRSKTWTDSYQDRLGNAPKGQECLDSVGVPRRYRRALTAIAVIALLVHPSNAPGGETTGPAGMQAAEVPSTNKASGWPQYRFSEGGLQLYRSDTGQERLTLGGEILGRYAYWDWFEGPSHDNEYDYSFQRTRLQLTYASKYLTGVVQPQYVHMFGVPDDAFKAPPEGPLGMGGLYFAHNNDTEPHDVGIRQAYLAVHSPESRGWLLKLGRFDYSDGLEVLEKSDGPHFNMIKNMHLSDRMISSFDWSAFGRSFDGVLAQSDYEKLNISASFFYPTQGGWEEDIDTTMDDIGIATFTLTGKRGSVFPGMELAGFYYGYDDNRDVTQRVDNTGLASNEVDIDIHMIGGHALGVYDVGPGDMDILFWGGTQFGDWYELDHQAYAFSAEAGYQFTEVFAKPWIRAGYYLGSGDGDPGDSDHETFFQMAPGTRKYNLLPYCDCMNTEDTFVQLITYPVKNLMVRTEYHVLNLNEADDRWYMGSGPTQEEGQIFGYIGRPTSGEDDLAQELHLLVNYEIRSHWSLFVSYSHIWGGDVVSGVYTEDEDANYLSLEMVFRI